MKTYAAHLILYVRLKSASQSVYPVWENVVLITASSEDEAFAKAEALGRSEEGDEDNSFSWDREPATWVFAGVRKLVECLEPLPNDGLEITSNQYDVQSLDAISKLVAGEPTLILLNDPFRNE